MIKITIRPPVRPLEVMKAVGKMPYLYKLSYCLDMKTVGELETTANLLDEAGIGIQSVEDIK